MIPWVEGIDSVSDEPGHRWYILNATVKETLSAEIAPQTLKGVGTGTASTRELKTQE